MKKIIFVLFVITCFFNIFSDTVKISLTLESQDVSAEYVLVKSWFTNDSTIIRGGKIYKKYFYLPKNKNYEISVYKDEKVVFNKAFYTDKDIKIYKHLDKKIAYFYIREHQGDNLKNLQITDGADKIYIDLVKENNIFTGSISVEKILKKQLYVKYQNRLIYGPINTENIYKINVVEYNFELPEIKKEVKKKNETKEYAFDVRNGENIEYAKVFQGNKLILNLTEKEFSFKIDNSQDFYVAFYDNKDNEIYNIKPDKAFTFLKCFNNANVYVENLDKDSLYYYFLDGMYKKISIKNNTIKDIFYIEQANLKIYKDNTEIHKENITGSIYDYNKIRPGFYKLVLRFLWNTDEEVYIYRNWQEGKYSYPGNYVRLYPDKDGVFEHIDYLKKLYVQDKREYFFRVLDSAGRLSPLYPVDLYQEHTVIWKKDLDSYKNRALYKVKVTVDILPVNGWDELFVKHDLYDFPHDFTGLVKSSMKLVSASQMTFEFEHFSHEGEKTVEIWGFNKESGEYAKIYHENFYLNNSKEIFFEYDKSEKENQSQKYYNIAAAILFIMIFVYFILYLIKKFRKNIMKKLEIMELNAFFEKQISLIEYESVFYDYLKKVKNKIISISEKDILQELDKILKKNSFIEEIIIKTETVDKSLFMELEKIALKDGVKLIIFAEKIIDLEYDKIEKTDKITMLKVGKNSDLMYIKYKDDIFHVKQR